MVSAEKWYAYQENYKQYGIDLSPKEEKKPDTNTKSGINEKDKLYLFALVILLGCICIGIIFTTSYCAQIQYNTNKTIKANTELKGEIDNLNVQIKSAVSLETLEYKSISQLGMVYPTNEQYVIVKSLEEENKAAVPTGENKGKN